MSFASPLDEWKFLVGEWTGTSKDQFGERGIIESTASFALEPSERFILGRGGSSCEGRLLNRSVSLLFYDGVAGKFLRETFFSYGFVNHEAESARGDGEIRFDIRIEPSAKQFAGLRWRSYLKRISDREVATGLEVAKGEGPFELYGETILHKRVE